jgi:YbbR domain-containing protein
VQLVAPNIAVQSLSPASVSLTIEKIDQRSYPVSMHYSGNANKNIVVDGAEQVPSTVTVQGPTSLLSQVTAVQVDIALPQTPQGFDAMVRPVAVNSLGQEVAGLEVAPDLVRVRVQFVKGTGASKTP